jgi:hypothetical protein
MAYCGNIFKNGKNYKKERERHENYDAQQENR